MIKKLFLLVLLTVSSMNMSAQSIGVIGAFNGWAADVVMNTTDNDNYTLSAYTFLSTGELKFRQDGAWAVNWGANTFPSGVGTQGGANIPVPAGTYDIAFNKTSGAYSFTAVVLNLPVIGFNGGFNQFGDRVDMVTADGVSYVKTDYYFSEPGVKFLNNATPPVMWGATAFPSGTATVGGPTIPLTPGFYNIDLNYTTGAYNFVETPVAIIGDAIIDFNTDIPMTSIDGGVTFTVNEVPLIGGKKFKFRTNFNWATNWGCDTFPSGTAVQSGNDILVDVSGTYNITFNRLTLTYTAILTASAYPQVEALGAFTADGASLNTTDGVEYKLDDYYFPTATGFKFALTNDNTTFWGSNVFSSGIATLGGGEIPVPVGNFNILFNKTTLAYDFAVTPISITGDGALGWGQDVYLTSTDNGINFTGTNIVLVDGSVKFRSNSSYAKAWGATTFPAGTASLTEQGNILVAAGTYNVTFNRVTGVFNFQDVLAVNQFGKDAVNVYPNPTNNVWNFASKNNAIETVTIADISGKTIFSKNVNALDFAVNAASFSNGIYFATVTSGKNVATYKLVKN
jgi:starch-binding outer membrane protein SusE/F